MKKIFILLVLFFLPAFAGATQGTCSYHGGVNCSIGMDSDGSAICNDGWRDSTESYYSVIECSGVIKNECIYPYSYGCTTYDDLDSLKKRINGIQSLTGMSDSVNQSQQNEINECSEQIKSYEESMALYQNCFSQNYSYDIENYVFMENEGNPDKTSGLQEETDFSDSVDSHVDESDLGNEILKLRNKMCRDFFDPLSNYNSEEDICECTEPTTLNNGKCLFESEMNLEQVVKKQEDFVFDKTFSGNITGIEEEPIQKKEAVEIKDATITQSEFTQTSTSTPETEKKVAMIIIFIKNIFSKLKFWD